MVALWSELPPAACDVAIRPVAGAIEPCFRRRLIIPGRRLHLFVLRASEFKASKPCVVTYRTERGRPGTEFEASPRLADWSTPSVAAVLHAIVDGLSGLSAEEDTRLLARFLSLTSSWAIPCRFHGTENGLYAAVFEFVPPSYGPVTVFAVQDGAVVSRKVIVSEHDEHSTCLLWRGDSFEGAYLELDGELLELKLEFHRGARRQPLRSWFADLAPVQQDAILDGWRVGSPSGNPDKGPGFGGQLPRSREFNLGRAEVVVDGLFAMGRRLYLVGDVPDDAEYGFSAVTEAGAGDTDFGYPHPAQPAGRTNHRRALIYRSDMGTSLDNGSPVRLTLRSSDSLRSQWIAVQGITDRRTRQKFRGLIAWDMADNDLVQSFAAAAVAAGSGSSEPLPAAVTLCVGSAPRTGPLMICHYGGDVQALRATLIAARLTLGDEATIRLVCRGRLSSADMRNLHAVCQSFAMRVDLVAVDEGAPLSDALILRPGDRRRTAILFAECGIVPLDPDWWRRIMAAIDGDGEALHIVQTVPQTNVSSWPFSSGMSPVVVAGPDVREQILTPAVELQTFEGFLHHGLAMAERAGRLARLEGLRFAMVDRAEAPASWFGEARLDDAVVRSLLDVMPSGYEEEREGNLVILGAARASGG